MMRDLNFDVEIVIAPIVREPDGLAMSSRNVYLNESERERALALYRSLQAAERDIKKGERSILALKKTIMDVLQSGTPTHIDYAAFIQPSTFLEIETVRIEPPQVLIALAARFGKTRLIDNSLITF
jgi:pantoate--beta-alanine ligase